MESRVNKYYSSEINSNESVQATRSSRNAKLYKHIYGKYEDLDNLPIEDNTNEIDMEKLRELVLSNTSKVEEEQIKENLNILEQRKRRIDEQKVYDINKILEKAKYENSKLKENTREEINPRKDLLATLGSAELSLNDIEKARKEYQEQIEKAKKEELVEELSMTRELKYKNLEQENETSTKTEDKSLFDTNSLSLDLFAELKPTGNTIITKPITSDLDKNKLKNTAEFYTNEEKSNTNKIDTSHIKSDIHSGDTRDIDIIKDGPTTTADDFFTNVYEFSKKDFADAEDDDFFDTPKKSGILKIILLILAIIVFIGVIIYFVGTYGMGLS